MCDTWESVTSNKRANILFTVELSSVTQFYITDHAQVTARFYPSKLFVTRIVRKLEMQLWTVALKQKMPAAPQQLANPPHWSLKYSVGILETGGRTCTKSFIDKENCGIWHLVERSVDQHCFQGKNVLGCWKAVNKNLF